MLVMNVAVSSPLHVTSQCDERLPRDIAKTAGNHSKRAPFRPDVARLHAFCVPLIFPKKQKSVNTSRDYTGLFEMIVGVLTTSHTQYT